MFDKVSWLVYLDSSLDGKAAHHAIYDMCLEDVCVLTETYDMAVELITDLTSDARILHKVRGPCVHYQSGFRKCTMEYFRLVDEPSEDTTEGTISTLLNKQTDWNVLIVSRSPGLDYLGFSGEIRNAVIVGEPPSEDHVLHQVGAAADWSVLQELCADSFAFLREVAWRQVKTTSRHSGIRSPSVLELLMRRTATFLLTDEVVGPLPTKYQVKACRARRNGLQAVVDSLPWLGTTENEEDIRIGHSHARLHAPCFGALWKLVSSWHSLRRAFAEGDPYTALSAAVSKGETMDPLPCVPLGNLPGVMGLELLILLVQFPEMAEDPLSELEFFRDTRPFEERYLELVGEEEPVVQIPKASARPPKRPNAGCVRPTEGRPATFLTGKR